MPDPARQKCVSVMAKGPGLVRGAVTSGWRIIGLSRSEAADARIGHAVQVARREKPAFADQVAVGGDMQRQRQRHVKT